MNMHRSCRTAAALLMAMLLALPLVPRHEVCDQPLTSDASAAEAEASPAGDEVAHPFAVLARLKPEGTA